MRILGIPFWPEKISDEQYVERTRKQLRALRRWRFIIALSALGIFGGFIYLIFLGVHLLGDLSGFADTTKKHPPDMQQEKTQLVYAAYYFAVLVGSWVGLMFGNAISHIGTILFTYRKDKLLVEFWDALSDAEKTRLRQTSS